MGSGYLNAKFTYLMKLSIENPLMPHASPTGMLLISNIFHPKWPIQLMVVYRPGGKVDTIRMVLHDGTGTIVDIHNP